jgi:hypothetical protein
MTASLTSILGSSVRVFHPFSAFSKGLLAILPAECDHRAFGALAIEE